MTESSNTSRTLVDSQVRAAGNVERMPPGWEYMGTSTNLSVILFSAKIDYITIETPGKSPLPRLDGTPRWVRSKHFKALTVHDPSAADIRALKRALGPAPILELEVAVDLRPRPFVVGEARLRVLEIIMISLFATGLDPSRGECMKNQFRAFYRRMEKGYIVRPFNMLLPVASDQQLHGGRDDDCQVKAYLKRTDQRVALELKDYVARVEVRICEAGLTFHGLATLEDLASFKFRRSLMPYFTHMEGTVRRQHAGNIPDKFLIPMNQWRDKEDRLLWKQSGVGAFGPGGKGDHEAVRLRRNSIVNNRIGQALGRLESQFRKSKSVCLPIEIPTLKSYLARPPTGFDISRIAT